MQATHRVIRTSDPHAHYEFCDLPDCSYLSEKGTCTKLEVSACLGEDCAFLQTASQSQAVCEKAQRRLAGLDEGRQQEIAQKYYGGQMPWKS